MGFFGLGTAEIVLIALVFILLFGGKKLPELARSIGKSARELKSSFKDESATRKGRKKKEQ